MSRKTEGMTEYSDEIKGDRGNYERAVRFDAKDGYVGITQWIDSHIDHILLSPGQFASLLKWHKRVSGSPASE